MPIPSSHCRKSNRFDSILVRLKGGGEFGLDAFGMRFRFHTGSIKRVALSIAANDNDVSIPYWFD